MLARSRGENGGEGELMRRYETMMVLHPELPEAQIRETIDRARRLVEGMGAEVHQIDEWGMRDLAYPIRKLNRGYYVVTEYSAEPKVVNEFERTMKLADEILRYISVAKSNTRRRSSASVARPVAKEPELAETDQAPEVEAAAAEPPTAAVAEARDAEEAVSEPEREPQEQAVEATSEQQAEAKPAAEETNATEAEAPQTKEE